MSSLASGNTTKIGSMVKWSQELLAAVGSVPQNVRPNSTRAERLREQQRLRRKNVRALFAAHFRASTLARQSLQHHLLSPVL